MPSPISEWYVKRQIPHLSLTGIQHITPPHQLAIRYSHWMYRSVTLASLLEPSSGKNTLYQAIEYYMDESHRPEVRAVIAITFHDLIQIQSGAGSSYYVTWSLTKAAAGLSVGRLVVCPLLVEYVRYQAFNTRSYGRNHANKNGISSTNLYCYLEVLKAD